MAIAHVQTKGAENTSTTTLAITYNSAITPGSLLVGCIRCGADTTISASDTVNSGWTEVINQVLAGHGRVAIFYFANTGAGTPTVTYTIGTTSSIRATIHEYSGAATSSVTDGTPAAETGSDLSSTGTDGPDITTTVGGDLVLAALGTNNSASVTEGTGWTRREDVPDDPSLRLFVQDRIEAGTGTFSADCSSLDTSSYIWVIAAFKQAAAGGGGRIFKLAGYGGGLVGPARGLAGAAVY